ncbi:hypothetical protein [Arenibaculum pallidiluteum]|uniref:hypothetical protein n=1 Tax=Arenibaculum pallidiluteum TaxID=2812559 RepID=UPI001A961220|nr:hypothetical protein [Arenibaculum pallidiluteum]
MAQRRFEELDPVERSALMLEAREQMIRAFGGGLPAEEQTRIIAAYLRRRGVRYDPAPQRPGA